MKEYSIKEVLEHVDDIPDSWLFLPNTHWTLETKGSFSLDSRDFPADSNENLPPQVESEGWIETLDAAMIQDVISYAQQKNPDSTIEDYLKAFVFYYKNDAFLET